MFTGIIESLGRIAAIETVGGDRRLTFASDDGYFEGVNPGDSIAVNGVCLTAIELPADAFLADLSIETLAATTANDWRVGSRVNLERALTASKPLGGHFVIGHVDGVGHLVDRKPNARSWRLRFALPSSLSHYVARKGSIAIDGVSLTVNEIAGDEFTVNLIPHTLDHTTLGGLVAGSAVNIEIDLIARYLERLMTPAAAASTTRPA